MSHRFLTALLGALLCACSAMQTTPSRVQAELTTSEVNGALVGKSRAEVEKYFGRKPDRDYGATSYVYYGNFADPDDRIIYKVAVVVFSHFAPDTVWSVGFAER